MFGLTIILLHSVAWKCNEKEYDCSIVAVLYEVKVKEGLEMETSIGSEVGRYGTVKHDVTLDDACIGVVNFNSEVLKDESVGMCNSEVNDLMVLMFICLLLVWTAGYLSCLECIDIQCLEKFVM